MTGFLGGLFASPQPTTISGLLDPANSRRAMFSNALMQAGLGLLNPDPRAPNAWRSGIGNALAGAQQGMQQGREDYIKNGLVDIQLQGMQREEDQRNTDKTAAEHLIGTLPPELQAKFGDYAKQYPADFLKAYTGAQLKAQYDTSTNGDRYGANGYWAQGADGKYHIVQPDKQGGAGHEIPPPEGTNWVPNTTYLDTGLGYQPAPTKGVAGPGNVGGSPTIPKNVADVEAEKKRGEAIDNYRSMASKMPGLEQVITQLDDLATKGTYTAAGRALDAGRRELGMDPRESAVARSQYIATIDNQILPLLRNTFGAQFTQVEGETLRATLGDPNKTPQEKQAVLKSFIEQKRRDVEAMALHAAAGTLNPADVATGGNTSGGPPPGVTAEEWGAMTPEERSHWQN